MFVFYVSCQSRVFIHFLTNYILLIGMFDEKKKKISAVENTSINILTEYIDSTCQK